MDLIRLSRAALPHLRSPVQVPSYDPTAVGAGIVHLGLGGFHRAHMARYTHDLFGLRPDMLGWGIVGGGLMPSDKRMAKSLGPQDNLYTLVERGGTEEHVTVIGSLAGVVFAGESSAALLDIIDQPGIRIVSMTVTENGYCLNRSTERLDLDHALISHDLIHPDQPRSAIGIIVAACRRRQRSGMTPFTALSCDNLQRNGTVLHDAVITLAGAVDPSLAAWIEANVSFPSTMVDRITPVTVESDIAELAVRFGIDDRWPVFSESFSQWVIEDRFVSGRPAWEEVGVQFVKEVAPYEFMKLRLLNASHLAVSGIGRLIGYRTIDESMANPLVVRYMTALMDRETQPTLMPVPGIDLNDYKRTLVSRFANTAIRDTVERVNTDAPLNALLDPIRDRLRAGQSVDLLGLALAAWLRRVRGEDEQGKPIDIRHPLAALLRAKAIEGGENPVPLLEVAQLFGDTGTDPKLVEPVRQWLTSLYRNSMAVTLAQAAERCNF